MCLTLTWRRWSKLRSARRAAHSERKANTRRRLPRGDSGRRTSTANSFSISTASASTLERIRSRLKRGEDDLGDHIGGAANLDAGHSGRRYDEGGNPSSESSRGGPQRSSRLRWVTFKQIVIVPHPSAAAKKSARVEAESLRAGV